MRALLGLFLMLGLAAGAQAPSAAHAQVTEMLEEPETVIDEPGSPEHDPLAFNAELLDELLVEAAEAEIRTRKFEATAGITGGTILLGLAAWRLIENEPHNAYTRGLGVMFLTLGMADLTTGIYLVARANHEERRLGRWRRARPNGITEVELAHFEGELQASQETRQGERMLVRWNGLTHAIAGALVLALTPIPNASSGSDRVSGYVIGSIFVATGMAAFGNSFRATPSEKAWNDYNARKMPMGGHELSWRFAPVISRRGAGLSFGATF
jgi:hypothetical protein